MGEVKPCRPRYTFCHTPYKEDGYGDKSTVFEDNRQHYMDLLARADLESVAAKLNLTCEGGRLLIPFFQNPILFPTRVLQTLKAIPRIM